MRKKAIFIIFILIALLAFFAEKMIHLKSEATGYFIYKEKDELIPAIHTTETQQEPILDFKTTSEELAKENANLEVISKVRCVDDRIELFLSNPTNKTIELVKDIKIHVNGMVVVDPKCNTYQLMPGKIVFCSDVSGHLAIREARENTVQLTIDSKKFSFIVRC